jgi:predicted outer membrane repeat protein
MTRLALGVLVVWAGVSHAQSVIFVRANAPDGGDGTSWSTAYNDLQAALADGADRPKPVQVWVAIGEYTPAPGGGDVASSFELVDGVELYGGFFGNENALADRDPDALPAVLSGDLNDDDGAGFVNMEDNARHVVRADNVSADGVLDGFVVIGGAASLAGEPGGGLLMTDAAPTIRNCLFVSNTGAWGAGVAAVDSTVVLEQCRFDTNVADGGGGGVGAQGGAVSLLGCLFESNVATRGAGASVSDADLTIVDTTFKTNEAIECAGGVSHRSDEIEAALEITNCVFDANVAYELLLIEASGGGLCVEGAGVTATIEDSVFTGNIVLAPGAIYARGGGAATLGVESATFAGTEFTANSAEWRGGAVYSDSPVSFQSCKFAGNTVAGDSGGGIFVTGPNDIAVMLCEFSDNHAWWDGGGFFAQSATSILIDSCAFSSNSADHDGGAVAFETDAEIDVVVRRSDFQGNSVKKSGGAIVSSGSYCAVEACTFTGNQALDGTGGVQLERGGANTLNSLSDSSFFANTGTSASAGGVHGWVSDCHFEGNESLGTTAGTLFVSGIVERCTFISNCGAKAGACSFAGSPGILRDSVAIGNVADHGGAFTFGGETAAIVNCVVIGNHATEHGGALWSGVNSTNVHLVNSLFLANTAGETGGLVRSTQMLHLHLLNSTVAFNHTLIAGGTISIAKAGSSFSAINSILWSNDVAGKTDESTIFDGAYPMPTIEFSHSIVEAWSGAFEGPANSGLAPQFVDEMGPDGVPGTGDEDLRLRPGSPCIDSATTDATSSDPFDADADGILDEALPIDLDGAERAVDDAGTPDTGFGVRPRPDIGAFEFAGTSCYPDCTQDEDVNILDFICFQNRFTTGHPKADCDESGSLSILDFICFSNAFSAGCMP